MDGQIEKGETGHCGRVNWDRFGVLACRDVTLMCDLSEMFKVRGPQLLRAIDDAAQSKNLKAFVRAAHTLKGTTDVFGSLEIVELARTLEATTETDLVNCIPTIGVLRQKVEELVDELDLFLREHEKPNS